jgi:hypothetical protein
MESIEENFNVVWILLLYLCRLGLKSVVLVCYYANGCKHFCRGLFLFESFVVHLLFQWILEGFCNVCEIL